MVAQDLGRPRSEGRIDLFPNLARGHADDGDGVLEPARLVDLKPDQEAEQLLVYHVRRRITREAGSSGRARCVTHRSFPSLPSREEASQLSGAREPSRPVPRLDPPDRSDRQHSPGTSGPDADTIAVPCPMTKSRGAFVSRGR